MAAANGASDEKGGARAPCVFCALDGRELVWSSELVVALRDAYPVSHGHTLVVPRAHVSTYFEASPDLRAELWRGVDAVKEQLDATLGPHGYNVGFNAGEAAGQTVMHLHVHVIPRYRGDMDDPRGGVRHVIPSRGNYLRKPPPLARGGDDPFSDHVFPLMARARDIAIVAAFVQGSGLDRLWPEVSEALARGARIRLLTGDYLGITQADALQRLLDWERSLVVPETDDRPPFSSPAGGRGELCTRVIEVQALPHRSKSFHPKSWRFEGDTFGVAYVGSSNISRVALGSGIEWNLRVDRDRDAEAYAAIQTEFENLWAHARALDQEWLDGYARRARERPEPLPPGELTEEPPRSLYAPHEEQQTALANLRVARDEGRTRALVVLATGLGKTLVSVLDYAQLWEETGRQRPPRLLFLAHRRELLLQAAGDFRTLIRERGLPSTAIPATVGWFAESSAELHADLVFASVAKLARREHLDVLRHERFDYVVVDEVHHAAADSYRRILDALPGSAFLLGLTATPERADGRDILGIFDDHVAHRAGLDRGIALGRLVPFHYFGVKDDIDYASIPWRNRRFDIEALSQAAQTQARMDTLWRAWAAHAGERTLVFCCSIGHANYVRDELRARGVAARAIHSGAGGDDRTTALSELKAGDIQAICAVDVLNEGIDVPSIDRVVMLRPTESSTVFLQQLGRGLRAGDDKRALTVIDFVGNHRIFLQRLRALLSLGDPARPPPISHLIQADDAVDLPAGCSVALELEAKHLLARLLNTDGAGVVERAYRELAASRGERDARGGLHERPTAGEMQRLGYPPSKLRERHGSWFGFVASEGDLLPEEQQALENASGWLSSLETTDMTKSFKMVTLHALLEHDALLTGMALEELAERAHAIVARDPRLLRDLPERFRRPPVDAKAMKRWLDYWMGNPIKAWTEPAEKKRAWFAIDDGRFVPAFSIEGGTAAALARMVAELVDYRLAQYRGRHASVTGDSFECRVTWNQRDPILKLPSRKEHDVPQGEVDARLADGSMWTFRFSKEFCIVARRPGAERNGLPSLMRLWFGPSAGHPGTQFSVRFEAGPDGWTARPVRGVHAIPFPRQHVAYYPDIQAAAGHTGQATLAPEGVPVALPLKTNDLDALFAVRVSGHSMDGGSHPMRHGDWAVFRVARDLPASAVENRVALFQVPTEADDHAYQIKRLARRAGGGWALCSDNPDGPTIAADAGTVVIGRLERTFQPESLAPARGTVLTDEELATAFGVDGLDSDTPRCGGHLFLFVRDAGALVEPTRLRHVLPRGTPPPRAAETAFVLATTGDRWRYLGVAHPEETSAEHWRLPEVDVHTWRALGQGGVSRTLPSSARARAEEIVRALLELPAEARWLEHPSGRRARIVGQSKRGGLRIAGDPTPSAPPFKERTVSLDDIGWAVVAARHVEEHGGLLDEARVNQLRYLEGTPKASTRYIDTEWALAAVERARPRLAEITDSHRLD